MKGYLIIPRTPSQYSFAIPSGFGIFWKKLSLQINVYERKNEGSERILNISQSGYSISVVVSVHYTV